MSESNSNHARAAGKPPSRPEGETTLFWHQSGRWCKKIRGRLVYFGRGSYAEALELYESQKANLHTGRQPRDPADPDHLTVYLLCAKFLTTKHAAVKTGELSPRSLEDYAATCKRIIKAFRKDRPVSDLGPDDFERLKKQMARTWGPVRLGNEMNRVRVVFSYGYKNRLIDRPMVFGEGFKRPSRRTLRRHRAERGTKVFEAAEVRKMIQTADQPLRSMILLGINCAFGNSDVGTLPLSAVDLDSGFVNYFRPKTGIDRRVPLWPETVEALRDWLARRRPPRQPKHAGAVFVTKYGGAWSAEGRALSNETRKLLDQLGINGHRGFYGLRHTFQTVGDESGDFIAVRRIMGHASNDIADVYRERVSDERLTKVTDHVRQWAFDGVAAKPSN
jgi:integrase